MQTRKVLRGLFASLFITISGGYVHLSAQTQDKPQAAQPEEIVELPSFDVKSARDTSYTGKAALSTTRTGVALMDLAQSVQVLNRTFMDEANAAMVADMLKYVGGGQTGNLNFSVDRFVMRGFSGEGDYQDGFRASQTEAQVDMANIERIEIIKGPSAIFIANGPVGGVMNKVSKAPTDMAVASLKVQAGLYDANRVELDLGGPITADKKLMYRTVVAGQYSDGYYDRTYVHRFLITPSVAYAFDPNTKLTVRYYMAKTNFSSYNGIPLDMRTDNGLKGEDRRVSPADVSPRVHFGEDSPLNWRRDIVSRFSGEFTTRPSDLMAMRVAVLWSDTWADRVESILSGIPASYTPGTKVNRNTTAVFNHWPRRELQNDYVFTFKSGPISHKLLTGFNFTDTSSTTYTHPGTSSPIDPYNPVFPGAVSTDLSFNTSKTENMAEIGKVFALETLSFAKDRVILSLGASRNYNRQQQTVETVTNASTVPPSSTITYNPLFRVYKSLYQWSALVKVASNVSVFYGYNENFSPNIQNGQVFPSQSGKQKEAGVKAELLDKKLMVNVAVFKIKQANLTAPSFPQTTPPSFVLVNGEESQGIDGDISWTVNKQIDILGSFAIFDAKFNNTPTAIANGNPAQLPVGNIAERTAGIWSHYKFRGALKGLSFGGGINFQDKKAITDSANSTFYGYIPARTLVDLSFGYDIGKIHYGLNIDNIFDKKFYYAARSNSVIIPGSGTNVKASVMYKF